ncbi:hypothetical protein ACFVGM_35190 [Kitasatospora purpeofusca]|uniref:hypothetical protein n=1 Tax=Kitasatospora purpeofusca TaxID=67352 RepID=UPI0036C5EEA8
MTDVTASEVMTAAAAVPPAERRAEALRPGVAAGEEWERRRKEVLDPSAPLEVRRRVIAQLEKGDPLLRELACTALPEALVDALIAHPSARVRGDVAERIDLTVAQRQRLLRDPRSAVRLMALHSGGPELVLEEADVDRLVADPTIIVREEVARRSDLSKEHVISLLGDVSGSVRAQVVGRAWPHLDEAARAALLVDRHSGIRAAAVLARDAARPVRPAVASRPGAAGAERTGSPMPQPPTPQPPVPQPPMPPAGGVIALPA